MFIAQNNDPSKDVGFSKTVSEKKLEDMIDNYDREMLKYIGALYYAINKETMDFTGIGNAVEALSRFNQKQEFNYLNNLLSPERCKGIKIPSPIPVPSCSFQLHNCVTLSTNASGNIGIIFNPFFLANNTVLNTQKVINGIPSNPSSDFKASLKIANLTTLWVNNDATLTGSSPNTNWQPVNIGQILPPVYDQFRLVSASIVVKYIGRLDIVSGVIGGAIVFDENNQIGGTYEQYNASGALDNTYPTDGESFAKYGNFDLAMDSFYHQENLTLEGIRELYFPIDNSFEEYVRLVDGTNININPIWENDLITNATFTAEQDYYKSGFNYFIYTLGAPANSACLKVDIYCNFECLPNAEFLNYMPLSLSVGSISSSEKKKAILEVQSKPIMKVKDGEENKYSNAIVGWKPYWNKMAQKFKDGLPGIGKLISNGIINAVPALKPALSMVGTMIGMDME